MRGDSADAGVEDSGDMGDGCATPASASFASFMRTPKMIRFVHASFRLRSVAFTALMKVSETPPGRSRWSTVIRYGPFSSGISPRP